MAEKMLLTLGISTLTSRASQAANVFSRLEVREDVERLIVIQGGKGSIQHAGSENIRIEQLDNMGLSLSRNALLRQARGDFVWLLDDDVILENQFVSNVLTACKAAHENTVCLLGQIGCSDQSGLYKNYRSSHGQLVICAGASSIEMVLRRRWFLEREIWFNEQFGLGGRYNSGEEFLFLNQARKLGGNIARLNEVTVKHPCQEANRITGKERFSQDESVICRAAIAREAGGITTVLLFVYWLLKVAYHSRCSWSLVLFCKSFLNYRSGK